MKTMVMFFIRVKRNRNRFIIASEISFPFSDVHIFAFSCSFVNQIEYGASMVFLGLINTFYVAVGLFSNR